MLVLVWMVLIPSALHARTITVNTTGDPGLAGTCDLRAAIANANNENQSGFSDPDFQKLAPAGQAQAFDAVMSIKWYDSPRHRLVNRGGDRDSHDARV